MAGGGTDIKLEEAAKKRGGLYVLLIQRAEAARVDRQLAGRCARQGDPGSYEEVLCLQHIDAQLLNCILEPNKTIEVSSPVEGVISKQYVERHAG